MSLLKLHFVWVATGIEQTNLIAAGAFRNTFEEGANQKLRPYQYFITQFKNTSGGRLGWLVAEEFAAALFVKE